MSPRQPSITSFGDAALLVTFGEALDSHLNAMAHALAERVRASRQDGAAWRAPVPGYSSVLVPFDPARMRHDVAEQALRTLLQVPLDPALADDDRPPLLVPVRYGGDDGPDLPLVAEHAGLAPEEVIRLHASVTYRAYLLGFAPGFAYLGTLPDALHIPRRATPRQRVPAGSVAIAGAQTAVYPLATPGGWQLIGRTDLVIWDAQRVPPALIEAGRRVRFVREVG